MIPIRTKHVSSFRTVSRSRMFDTPIALHKQPLINRPRCTAMFDYMATYSGHCDTRKHTLITTLAHPKHSPMQMPRAHHLFSHWVRAHIAATDKGVRECMRKACRGGGCGGMCIAIDCAPAAGGCACALVLYDILTHHNAANNARGWRTGWRMAISICQTNYITMCACCVQVLRSTRAHDACADGNRNLFSFPRIESFCWEYRSIEWHRVTQIAQRGLWCSLVNSVRKTLIDIAISWIYS